MNGPGSRELEALRQGLRELGYLEGQTIHIESRVSDGDNQRLPALAAELASLGVDVLVTDGPPAAAAARNATRTIPIVMGIVAEPVTAGLVESLGRPGGNITGFTALVPGIFGQRLQLFKEAVPNLVRLAALYDPTTPVTAVTDTQAAAPALGLELQIFTIRALDELDAALGAASAAHLDGLVAIGGPLEANARGRIVGFATEHRVPGSYPDRDYALAGGLMTYGPNISDILRRSASYVDKVLKGANAGDLPIQQPTKFEFVVNLTAAQALGVSISPAVLAQATEVLQ